MTPEFVKAIIDQLFAELEAKLAGKVFLLVALHAINVLADDLVPTIFAKLAAQGATPPAA